MSGPAFLPLHALTDELTADLHAWSDRVAERAVALGFYVDARPSTVAAAAGPFPIGRVTDLEAITDLVERIDTVTASARSAMDELEAADPVAHHLTIDILEGLEKHQWMLTAQTR